jgi:mRNA interferase HigB
MDFAEKHRDAAGPLDVWLQITRHRRWRNLTEVRKDFPSADLVGRRTVFNIGGNKYRLIARVNFEGERVFVLHILTHSEYDKGDWKKGEPKDERTRSSIQRKEVQKASERRPAKAPRKR